MKTNLPSQQALDKKAENARELGLDYDPSTGTQVSKVWWDGDRLMAQPIPPENLYKEPEQPAQQEPVECKTLCELCVKRSYHFCANSAQTTLIPSPPAQRTWVGLTDAEWMNIVNKDHAWFGQRPEDVAHEVAKLIEAKLKEKNT